MKNTPAKFILGAILAAGAGASVAGAQELDDLARFKAENARLRIRNVNLQESLVEANRREKESAEALVKIKVRLQQRIEGEHEKAKQAKQHSHI